MRPGGFVGTWPARSCLSISNFSQKVGGRSRAGGGSHGRWIPRMENVCSSSHLPRDLPQGPLSEVLTIAPGLTLGFCLL